MIDPAAKTFDIPYAYLATCHRKGTLEYVGRLPDDTRIRIAEAVRNNISMRKAQKEDFFRWYDKNPA